MWTAPFSSAGVFTLGNYGKLLAVRRQVVVQISATVLKLLLGPQARLARYERVSRRCAIHHHDAAVRALEEQLPAVARPDW
jgi:hypothetical protein